MSFMTRLHEAQANSKARTADPGDCRWNGCTVRSATMASSELLRSCCSISSRCRNAAEEPARAAVSRS